MWVGWTDGRELLGTHRIQVYECLHEWFIFYGKCMQIYQSHGSYGLGNGCFFEIKDPKIHQRDKELSLHVTIFPHLKEAGIVGMDRGETTKWIRCSRTFYGLRPEDFLQTLTAVHT